MPARVRTIAVRKTCNPDGVGRSHYVLMSGKVSR
jgi:modified peptide precursor CbpA